ncbi:MAG: hypothetical protein FJX72_20315 [Armatimonadetes bacterium]|nr:hypothetical protein [Armatimonadota bacterium]
MAQRLFREMVCLVGENPLPVYLGIADLCEQGAEIWLVHSADTRKHALAISTKLGNRWRCGPDRLVQVDPFAPADVLDALIALLRGRPGMALNFTGGTKVMSAFALQAHIGADPTDMRLDRAVYLEDRGHVFRFCDGETQPVSDRTQLRLHDIVELHGGRIMDTDQWPPCTTGDLERMWRLFCDKRLRPLYRLAGADGPSTYEKLSGQWDVEARCWRDGEWRGFLSLYTQEAAGHPWWATVLPSGAEFENWEESRYSDLALQWRFATGVWLELLAGYLAACALTRTQPVFDGRRLDLGHEIVSGAQVIWNGQPFQADIMLVRRNRLRLISATTGQAQDKVKVKMFEAQARARQVGGGLAYAAVVAPLGNRPRPGSRLTPVAECQRTVDPDRRHRIFGRADLERWMEGSGLDDLRDYLTM